MGFSDIALTEIIEEKIKWEPAPEPVTEPAAV
jgi:hypothetical protein